VYSQSKKILILSTRLPYPLLGGDRIRINNFCKALAQQHRVDLLVISEGKVEQEHINNLKKLGIGVTVFSFSSIRCKINALKGMVTKIPLQVSYYYFKEVQQWIDGHIHEYDVTICNHIRGAEYFRKSKIKKIIDLHDAISLNYFRASEFASGIWKQIYSIENTRLLPYELHAIESFDKALIVSSVDRNFLISKGANAQKISVLPVAVDDKIFTYKRNQIEKDWIVFVGKMNTVANADAAVYFTTMIFPQIQSILPNIELFIVGADPSSSVKALAGIHGVHVTGRVENHLEYISQAKVVIDPMRFGAGMQNKVLEAMAMSKTVVASTLATEGIEGEHNKHFIVADSIDNVVNSIVNVMCDSALRERIGQEASALIREKYSWGVVGNTLQSIVHDVCNT